MDVPTPTNEMLHKAMIHLALAVNQLADALQAQDDLRTAGPLDRCRHQINNTHRQLVFEDPGEE